MTTSYAIGEPYGPSYPAGRTRRELREMIARSFCGPYGWIRSTVTAASSTFYLIDERLLINDADYWRGACLWLEPKANVPNGYETFIRDYDPVQNRIYVHPSFTIAPEIDDRYQLFKGVSRTQINDAINEVCRGGWGNLVLQPDENTVAYSINDSTHVIFRPQQIRAVWRIPGADPKKKPQLMTGWTVRENHGVMTMYFPEPLRAEDTVWVEYEIAEGGLWSDDSRTNIPSEIVRLRALIYLAEMMLTSQDATGLEKWGQLVRYWNERLREAQRKYQLPPRKIKVESSAASSRDFLSRFGIEEKYE